MRINVCGIYIARIVHFRRFFIFKLVVVRFSLGVLKILADMRSAFVNYGRFR